MRRLIPILSILLAAQPAFAEFNLEKLLSQQEKSPAGQEAGRESGFSVNVTGGMGALQRDDTLASVIIREGADDGSAGGVGTRSASLQERAADAAAARPEVETRRQLFFPFMLGNNSGTTSAMFDHMKELSKSMMMKGVAQFAYSDPTMFATLGFTAENARANNMFSLVRTGVMDQLDHPYGPMAGLTKDWLGCIDRLLNVFKGDMNLTMSACSTDQVVAVTDVAKGSFEGKGVEASDGMYGQVGFPGGSSTSGGTVWAGGNPTIGGNGPVLASADIRNRPEVAGLVGERSAMTGGNSALTKSSTPGSTTPTGYQLGTIDVRNSFLSVELFDAKIRNAQGLEATRLEQMKVDFVQLVGDLKVTYARLPRPGAAGSSLYRVYFTDIVPSIPRAAIFKRYRENTWKLMIDKVKAYCDYKMQGGGTGANYMNRDSFDVKPFYTNNFTRDTTKDELADLSLAGAGLTPTNWEVLAWFATKGRTGDKLTETCNDLAGFNTVATLEAVEKMDRSDGNPTPQIIRNKDMLRAYYWYVTYVTSGKVYSVYRRMYNLVLEKAMAGTTNREQTRQLAAAVNMVERAIGVPPPLLRGREEMITNELREYIERLRRYRQGAYSPAFVPDVAQRGRNGVGELTSGGVSN